MHFRFRPNIMMLALLITVCASLTSCHTTKKIKSRPGRPEIEEIHVKNPDRVQKKIVAEARKWIGTPYKYAYAECGVGTDCSGLVLKVYEKVTGEKLPRNSAKQAEYCIPLDASQIETGDLVFFATGKDPERISHVGIIIDDENFIHASSSKGVVISKLANNYYQKHFRMFGRAPGMQNASSVQKKKRRKH